jgi:CheY-like chemotaxis protein/anti-sigma regulatory factor (Ser/Thr protein kinase)
MQGAAVRADRTRLRQVLLNLLSNAIKYNRDGGSVRIEARAQGADRMRILVTDTGVGIPAARLSELFQPFSRLGNENSGIEGTGIGLTITRRNVELMGGTVNVESEVGVGSRFWIELPLESLPLSDQDHEGTSATNTKQQPKHIETAQHTILYIEDNPSNLKLVAQILGRRKHIHLLTAHTPERGIELALARRPDLILLDINMPGMDGYQVLEVFRADVNLKQIPVVAITANVMLHDIERDRAADFTDYLSKPLDFGQFLTTIDRCLGGGEENANHAGRTDSR